MNSIIIVSTLVSRLFSVACLLFRRPAASRWTGRGGGRCRAARRGVTAVALASVGLHQGLKAENGPLEPQEGA